MASGCMAQPTLAQGGTPPQAAWDSGRLETRPALEALARTAEAQRRTSEAWLLRARLRNGDFQEGDRIVIVIEGAAAIVDTQQVRSGKKLQFPQMGELSLVGVLRSELSDTVQQHLSKYLTSRVIRASALVPVAVLGAVHQPGFYYLPADNVLRDVIMRAGGPQPTADLGKIVVRREGSVIWDADDMRVALADGLSVDALHLRAGDEIVVGQRRQFQISTVTTVVSMVMALTLAVVQLAR
jgi:protein involved in polysaccharide export with SLBB domain